MSTSDMTLILFYIIYLISLKLSLLNILLQCMIDCYKFNVKLI